MTRRGALLPALVRSTIVKQRAVTIVERNVLAGLVVRPSPPDTPAECIEVSVAVVTT